jgi:hypothetical protein
MQDWEKKYWQQKQQQALAKQQQQQRQPAIKDISDQLQARIQSMTVASQNSEGGKVADLREGLPYFTKLNTQNFGNGATLFKSAGVISGKSSKNVTIKKEVNGMVVDGVSVVDFGKLQENPLPNITLIEVSVPFLGVFFVQKEAVVSTNSGPLGDGRSLLKG